MRGDANRIARTTLIPVMAAMPRHVRGRPSLPGNAGEDTMAKKLLLGALAAAAAVTIGMAVYYIIVLVVYRTLP